MNERNIITLLIASFIIGIFISSRDITLCMYLYNTYGFESIKPAILDTAVVSLFSFILVFCLLWINLMWSGRYGKGRLLLLSFGTAVILCCIAFFFVKQDFPREYFNRGWPEHNHDFGHGKDIFPLGLKSIIILCLIYAGGQIYSLYVRKIEAEKSLEKIRAESLQSRLTALSNQINPHFFFNALNSLHSLINDNKKESSLQYLANLSIVFRYILQSENKSLVTLKEEMEFLTKYEFMLSVKFGGKILFDCSIEEKYMAYFIPVLALLPVVENIIKHNEISSRNPMTVYIYIERESLAVKNKVVPKIDPPATGGIGLKNLNNRYLILTDSKIKIINNSGEFILLLPLIRSGI